MFRIPDIPWLSGLVLVVGIIAFIVAIVTYVEGKGDDDGTDEK